MQLTLRTYFLSAVLIISSFNIAFAQTEKATISTDLQDYPPGSVVTIKGSGFMSGETVQLQVLHQQIDGDNDISPAHQPWIIAADDNGNLSSSWTVPLDEDELGATLKLTADGKSSGLHAEALFTDALHAKVEISATSGIAGQSQTYIIKITNTNTASTVTKIGSVRVYLPIGFNAPPTLGSIATSNSGNWSYYNSSTAGYSNGYNSAGRYIGIKANSSGDEIPNGGYVSLSVTVTNPTTAGNYIWTTDVSSNSSTNLFLSSFPLDIPPGQPTVSIIPTTDLSVASVIGTYGGTVNLTATLTSGGTTVSGKTITFYLNGNSAGSTTTNLNGVATLTSISLNGINAETYSSGVSANFTGDANYAASSGTAQLTVNKADPNISWNNPSSITYGTAISSIQLNATTSGDGALTYSPLSGTILNAGTQTLNVGASETTNYNAATGSVSITVNKADQNISWNNPSSITYGTAISSIQLNATTSGDGALTYSPLSGTILNAGTQTLNVSAAETNNYNAATASVSLIVNKANQNISWNNPSSIIYGTALNSTQLNATTSGDGGLTYSPASGTILNAGTQTLNVTTAETDNYNAATASVSLVVDKANQNISWNNPSSIIYGTALNSIQLNAATSGDGALVYSSLSGTILNAGIQTLNVSAAETNNYNAATASVSLIVNKAPATLLFSNLSYKYDGTLKTAAATTIPIGLTGVTVNGSGIDAGLYSASASLFNPNYSAISINGILEIAKADAIINITGYNGIYDGLSHGATGTATGVGGIDFSSAVNFGSSFTNAPGGTANWTFTGGANYNDQKGSAQIVITKRPIEVTATAKNKIYGSTDPALTYSITSGSLITGDNFNGSLSRVPGENIGAYQINQNTLSLNNNYSLSYISADLTITKAILAVTANALSSQYSDLPLPFTASITGYINGEGSGIVSGKPSFITSANLSASGAVQSPAGSYVITPSQGSLTAANYDFQFINGVLNVTEENADINYSGLTYFSTGSSTSTSAKVTLQATAKDINDGINTRGNILQNAVVDFRAGNKLTDPAPPFTNPSAASGRALGAIIINDNTQGLASTDANNPLTYILQGSEVTNMGTSITIFPMVNKVIVGSFYTGVATQPTIITITIPGQDNISGGGYVNAASSAGIYADPSVPKLNFGFTMKYNKSGSNLQGQANIIFRTKTGVNYQIKSNAINSLAVGNYPATGSVTGQQASFTTKATLTDMSTGSSVGNLNLNVQVVQSTVIGGKDMFVVTLTDPKNGGLLYSNNWTGSKAVLQNLDGGKVSIRGAISPASYSSARTSGGEIINSSSSINKNNSFKNNLLSTEEKFSITVMPNPSVNHFTLQLHSGKRENIFIRVTDASGKIIEQKNNLPANSLLQIGDAYIHGVYFVQASQGVDKIVLRLVKL